MGDQEPPPDRTLEIRGQLRFRTRMQSRPKRCSTSPQLSAARDAALPRELPCAPRGLPRCVCSLTAAPFAFYSFSQRGGWGGVPSAPSLRVTKTKTVSITRPSPPAPVLQHIPTLQRSLFSERSWSSLGAGSTFLSRERGIHTKHAPPQDRGAGTWGQAAQGGR